MSEYIIEKKKVLPRFENMIKEWGGNTSIQFPIRAKGFLDKKKFEQAVQKLVDEHDAFRFVFEEGNDGKHYYSILKALKYNLDYRVLRGETLEERYEDFLEQVARLDDEADDMNKKRPWDIILFEMDREDTILFLRMTHLLGDGQSNIVIWTKIAEVYKGCSCPKAPGFLEYLQELEEFENSDEGQRRLKNWKDCLNSYEQVKKIPGVENVFSRTTPIFMVNRLKFEAYARKNKLSFFHMSLFCFHVALSLTFGKKETLIKVPNGTREFKYNSSVGCFINGILSKFKIEPDKKISELVKDCRDNYFYAEKNIKCGYSTDICDFHLTYQNYAKPKEMLFADLPVTVVADPKSSPCLKRNFTVISVSEKGDNIGFAGCFDVRIFSPEVLPQFKKNFELFANLLTEEDKTFRKVCEENFPGSSLGKCFC